jgi:hypothetical protein
MSNGKVIKLEYFQFIEEKKSIIPEDLSEKFGISISGAASWVSNWVSQGYIAARKMTFEEDEDWIDRWSKIQRNLDPYFNSNKCVIPKRMVFVIDSTCKPWKSLNPLMDVDSCDRIRILKHSGGMTTKQLAEYIYLSEDKVGVWLSNAKSQNLVSTISLPQPEDHVGRPMLKYIVTDSCFKVKGT